MAFHYSNVFVQWIGIAMPPEVVRTSDLERPLADIYAKYGLPPDLVEKMTGIRERRFWPARASIADFACRAAHDALERAGVHPQDLGALIYGSVCREALEPATACLVAAQLGVSHNALIYDLANACLSMLNGVVEVANRIELGQIRCGLVVGCESARDIITQTVRRLAKGHPSLDELYLTLATLTGGSGAAAILLTDGTLGQTCGHRLLGGVHQTWPQAHGLCRWEFVSHPDDFEKGLYAQRLTTHGPETLREGIALAKSTWDRFLPHLKWDRSHIGRVITHQVGRSNRQRLLSELCLDPRRDFPTYGYLGNMGAVALPMTIGLAERDGVLTPGQRVALLGIASGLSCMMLGVEW